VFKRFAKTFARVIFYAASYHARRAPSFKSTPSSNNCNACGVSRSFAFGLPALCGQ
jgi:hypothetical protein